MKLSRDKISDNVAQIVAALPQIARAEGEERTNDVRLDIVRAITELLVAEEKVTGSRAKRCARRSGTFRKAARSGTCCKNATTRRIEKAGHRFDPIRADTLAGLRKKHLTADGRG